MWVFPECVGTQTQYRNMGLEQFVILMSVHLKVVEVLEQTDMVKYTKTEIWQMGVGTSL